MTSIKSGSFSSAMFQKLQQTGFEEPSGATSKTANTPALPPVVAQLQDAFETVRNQIVDLTGGNRTDGKESTDAVRAKEDAGEVDGGRTVVNPELQAFLAEHPEIHTVQDFIAFCYAQEGGARYFSNKCAEFGLSQSDLNVSRTANMADYVYSGPELAENLPHTAEAANEHFITQFGDATYNPDAANSTTNCGPTSLAMALNTAGKMPEGLTPEQQIDYARALMYPDNEAISYIDVGGEQIPQLDQDHEFTNIDAVENGAEQLQLTGDQGAGWGALDDALASGQPVVCAGNVSTDWKNQFPDPSAYHLEGQGHFIAVLGRTENGNYLVADPLNPGGVVEMNREQLAVFFQGTDSGTPEFSVIG